MELVYIFNHLVNYQPKKVSIKPVAPKVPEFTLEEEIPSTPSVQKRRGRPAGLLGPGLSAN